MENRQIKFRAWDKSCNKMRGKNGLKDCFSLRSDGVSHDDYILMQFTNHFDKNGKPIYEGDVLSNSTGKIDKVIFYENGFFGKSKSNMGKNHYWYNPLCADYIKNKEVIGNIYENPELLKDK